MKTPVQMAVRSHAGVSASAASKILFNCRFASISFHQTEIAAPKSKFVRLPSATLLAAQFFRLTPLCKSDYKDYLPDIST